jgi:GNAT superfamily N-acetyltransferase
MIHIEPTNDKELLDSLSVRIFGAPYEGNVGYVLYCEDEAVGLAKLSIKEEVTVILSAGILPEMRGMGLGDFLLRSLMARASDMSDRIEIGWISDYFIKFGFRQQRCGMVIESKDLVFPRKCCHCS